MADGIARVLVDSSGNLVGVVVDDTVYRLQTETKQGPSGDSDDAWPTTLFTSEGEELSVRRCLNEFSLLVHSDDLFRLLRDIKLSLNILNMHMETLTGLKIIEDDLEEQE